MKRSCLISLIPLIMMFAAGRAPVTACTDFGDESASYFFEIESMGATARYGDLIVVSTGSAIQIYDLTSGSAPTCVASRTNGAGSLHVSGTTLVTGINNRIILYELPSLEMYRVITVSGAVELTGSGDRIGVLAGTSFLLYDVSDPFEPALRGSAEHGASWDECAIAMNGDTAVFTTTNGTSPTNKGSELWVVDLDSGPDLEITHVEEKVPFPTDSRAYLQQVIPWGDHFIVRGATYSATARSYDAAFVAHFGNGGNGPFWGQSRVSPDKYFARMAPWNDDLLIVGIGGSIYSTGSYAYTTYLGRTGDGPDDPVKLVQADLKLWPGPLTAWPDLGILRVGYDLIRVEAVREGASRWLQGYGLGADVARVMGTTAFLLDHTTTADPGGCGSWFVSAYDLSGEAPVRLDTYSEYCYSADGLWIIGDHAYVDANINRCLDISDPSEFGIADTWNVSDVEDMLAWDDVVVVSRGSGGIDIYALDSPSEWRLLASHPDLPSGGLRRIGDLLLILDRPPRTFDMTNPLSPTEVPNTIPISTRLIGLGPERILTTSGDLLRVYDVSDLTDPVLLGGFESITGIRFVQATANRVYVTSGVGLTVLDLTPEGSLARVGGHWDPEIAYAMVAGTRLLLSYGPLLPLDCGDTVPNAVSAFRSEWTGVVAQVSWSSMFGDPGLRFEVTRVVPGQERTLVGWRPAVAGEHEIQDADVGPGTATYELHLADPGGRSVLLATSELSRAAPQEPAPVLVVKPNPANPRATVFFSLERPGPAHLAVYAPDGRLVARLVDENLAAGTHELTWDGCDGRGRALSSGVYLLRLETDRTVRSRRMTLLK